MKAWIGRILLFFAIFTLGFGLGRDSGRRQRSAAASPWPAGDVVLVYYLHGDIRCETCNSIEAMARRVVETEFAVALAAGRLEWRTANFLDEPELASLFEVTGSNVAMVRVKDGKVLAPRRVDEAWVLYREPEVFAAFLGDLIREYLGEEAL